MQESNQLRYGREEKSISQLKNRLQASSTERLALQNEEDLKARQHIGESNRLRRQIQERTPNFK